MMIWYGDDMMMIWYGDVLTWCESRFGLVNIFILYLCRSRSWGRISTSAPKLDREQRRWKATDVNHAIRRSRWRWHHDINNDIINFWCHTVYTCHSLTSLVCGDEYFQRLVRVDFPTLDGYKSGYDALPKGMSFSWGDNVMDVCWLIVWLSCWIFSTSTCCFPRIAKTLAFTGDFPISAWFSAIPMAWKRVHFVPTWVGRCKW